MSQLFALDAQKCGIERHVRATSDGLGIVVDLDGRLVNARSVNEAIREARDYIGEYLQPAQRGGIPWGLLVTVSDGIAAYGEWPLAGGGGGSPSFQNTPLVRIHQRWHRGSGPLSALENAIQIIREYTRDRDRGRRAA
jgi:hypothetical protein